jgi:hypothetical protein
LGGKDEDGNVLTSLFLEEQKSVAKIALLAAEGIVSGGITSRNEDHLKYLTHSAYASTSLWCDETGCSS